MSFVSVKDVYKRYKMGEITINASDGISFDIEKGELAIVLGPSGSGKTTVLNMLGGMDTIDEGSIMVDGKDIAKYSKKSLYPIAGMKSASFSSSIILFRILRQKRISSLLHRLVMISFLPRKSLSR